MTKEETIVYKKKYREEQKECFHYSNLQPLWVEDNFKKGHKWEVAV